MDLWLEYQVNGFWFLSQRLGILYCFLRFSYKVLFGGLRDLRRRLGSLTRRAGFCHLCLFKGFRDRPGSGLNVRWGTLSKTTPSDDVVSTGFETLLLCRPRPTL